MPHQPVCTPSVQSPRTASSLFCQLSALGSLFTMTPGGIIRTQQSQVMSKCTYSFNTPLGPMRDVLSLCHSHELGPREGRLQLRRFRFLVGTKVPSQESESVSVLEQIFGGSYGEVELLKALERQKMIKLHCNEWLDRELNWIAAKINQRAMIVEEGELFRQALNRATSKQQNVLRVDIDDLRINNNKLFASRVIENPIECINLVKGQNRVQFVGNLGENYVTPRGLTAKMAGQLVGIQGIVTKMSQKKCILKKAALHNPLTGQVSESVLFDKYSPDEVYDPETSVMNLVMKDREGNNLTLEYGLCNFRDMQYIVVQQLPQNAPAGLIPFSVQVYLQDSLVGKVKPGDRVQVVGIYRLNVSTRTINHGIFSSFIIATSIRTFNSFKIHKAMSHPKSITPRIYELLANSVAPSVYGHRDIKKGILLSLVGGVQKTLEGTRLRGNINLLMVGDPGTAKSQLLRYVLQTADISVGTSGSGASGVGLTASVNHDKQSGDRILQAGAMVLADRGIVCIDQFDKMNEEDRVAIHQVMEQQTVTIAKAGICCSLNARCSVVAAANPIYGEYKTDLPPTKNIGFPDSLLSRFDLIFIVQDKRDEQLDALIAERVCKNHQYCAISVSESSVGEGFTIEPISEDPKKQKDQGIYEKNPVFSCSRERQQVLSQKFLKDYIMGAKSKRPEMTLSASNLIQKAWIKLRKLDFQKKEMIYKVLPITIRTLQTFVRLSTSHAKIRLSDTVEEEDVRQAVRLFSFSLFGQEHGSLFQLQSDEMEVQQQPQPSRAQPSASRRATTQLLKANQLSKEMQRARITDQQIIKVSKGSQLVNSIYKTLVDMTKGKKSKMVKWKELLEVSKLEEEKVEECLKMLSDEGKIFLNGSEIRLL